MARKRTRPNSSSNSKVPSTFTNKKKKIVRDKSSSRGNGNGIGSSKKVPSSFANRKIICERPILDMDHYKHHHLVTPMLGVGWEYFLTMSDQVFPDLVRQFYYNLEKIHDHTHSLESIVNGTKILVTPHMLSQIIHVPHLGEEADFQYNPNTWTYSIHPRKQLAIVLEVENVVKHTRYNIALEDLPIPTRFMHHLITYNIVPRDGHRGTITRSDTFLLAALKSGHPIDLPHVIIQTMIKAKLHSKKFLPYAMLLTKVFKHANIDVSNHTTVPHGLGYTKDSLSSMGFQLQNDAYVRSKATHNPSDEHNQKDDDLLQRLQNVEKQVASVKLHFDQRLQNVEEQVASVKLHFDQRFDAIQETLDDLIERLE